MNIKGLLKDTAIYGLSSIVGRFLNYMLTPIYTRVISAESGGYGIVNEVYAYTALILVVLTFGMETTFFRYANDEKENRDTVFSTTFAIVFILALSFLTGVFVFIDPIGEWMGYPDHHEYILMMAVCVAIDAIQAIPFCLLRFQKRPIKFASLKLLNIILSIALTLFYFCVLGYDDVFYIFAINLACSALLTFAFVPEFFKIHWHVDFALFRRMFSYSWPILVLGIAGILNQTLDKMIFRHLYVGTSEEALMQLGIYGACFKIAMIMGMITQAFRFAYEPIVFATNKEAGSIEDKKKYYALAMKYFVIFTLLAFLSVMAFIDILLHIIGEGYREGLRVVPIVMAAEIFMGIYFNLSFWYKLIDKTLWGAVFSIAGCVVLVVVNVLMVPRYGYMACAWGGFAGYATCMALSYVVGQIKNPIPYDLRSIFSYAFLAILLYGIMEILPFEGVMNIISRTVLLGLYFAYICYKDFPLGKIIHKFAKR
ncbi:MAG: oligosaccharide flippase family protein [Bacteroidales bacterium]|nr:oligosaccharide flippase family protein [Bacteroidales bacterium]